MPRTGNAQGQTDSVANGIKLAIAEFEKGLPFDIVYADKDDADAKTRGWDAGKEAENAREAAANRDVMAYIGPYNSGAAKVSMPILNNAGLVQISPAATYPGLTKKVKRNERNGEPDIYRTTGLNTFCRVCPHDDSQGPNAAIFVAKELKARSVYIIEDGDFYGPMIADGFEEKCKELKLEVLGRLSLEREAQISKPQLLKIKDAKPDAIFFGGTTQSGGPQVAIGLKASGFECPLVVPDGCYDPAFIKAAGEDVVNGRCYATIGGLDPSDSKGAAAEFAKRYKETYKSDPEQHAIYGYEAAAVILTAIKAVGRKDRDLIRKAVLATKNFNKGALGKWSFDADGDTTLQQTTVSKIEKGKFIPVAVIAGEV